MSFLIRFVRKCASLKDFIKNFDKSEKIEEIIQYAGEEYFERGKIN